MGVEPLLSHLATSWLHWLLLLPMTGQSPAQSPPCFFRQRAGSGSSFSARQLAPRNWARGHLRNGTLWGQGIIGQGHRVSMLHQAHSYSHSPHLATPSTPLLSLMSTQTHKSPPATACISAEGQQRDSETMGTIQQQL